MSDGPAASARAERLLLAAGLSAAFLFCLGSMADPDLPWHLSAGRRIAASGRVPREDWLSWTMGARPWIDFEWGSELLFHATARAADAAGLWALKSAAFLALTLGLVSLLRLWRLPRSVCGLAAAAFAAALFPLSGLRPEVFSWLFFLGQLYVLESRRLGRPPAGDTALLAWHGLAYVLWANLHAGFPTGLALCCCYGAAELLEPGGKRTRGRPLALAAAAVLGTLANPFGHRLYEVLWDHGRHWTQLSGLIQEWSAPDLGKPFVQGFWLLIAFSFAGLVAASGQGRPPAAAHLFAVALFGLLSSRAVRTMSYGILLVFPLGLSAWDKVRSPAWLKPRIRTLAAMAAAGLVVWRGAAATGPRGIVELPAPLEAQGPRGVRDFLRAEKATLSGLRLYNPYNWGGYFGYTLSPDYKVFIDGRYLFADLLAEVNEADVDPAHWRGLMAEKRIDVAVLYNDGLMLQPRNALAGRPFSVYAMPRAEWALVYWDSVAAVFARRAEVPADWLARREFRWIYPRDLRHCGLAVLVGAVSLDAVAGEIGRYAREIGDPRETALLERWLGEFRGKLDAVRSTAPAARS